MSFVMDPIGVVRAARRETPDDFWGGAGSTIELAAGFSAESLRGLDEFSHAEIVFVFDQVKPEDVDTGARHPRRRADWPLVGIFAQRGKNRPNRIGVTVVRVLRVQGAAVVVTELDAVDGTPVLDIKPVLREFRPRDKVRQPPWAMALMQDYWRPS